MNSGPRHRWRQAGVLGAGLAVLVLLVAVVAAVEIVTRHHPAKASYVVAGPILHGVASSVPTTSADFTTTPTSTATMTTLAATVASPNPAKVGPSRGRILATPTRTAGAGGSGPVVSQPGPTQPPGPKPTQPVDRSITVYNKVTDGASGMREDSTPAYLSTVPHDYCRDNGCMLTGSDVSTGATLTAMCQIQGDQTTNGDNQDSVDANNPGRYTSTLWYGIKWVDGRFGYISEVWINAGERGGLGLPGC